MNKRRRLTGTVKSNKMDKTVIVDVTRTFQHPLYHKVVRSVKSFKAHDEIGCNIGDKVVIVESAPFSKTVTWMVEKVVKIEIRQESLEAVEEAIIKAEELQAELEAEKIEETDQAIEDLEEEGFEEVAEIIEESIDEELEEVEEMIEDEEGAA
ncbi:MAG: 30S ribosomal protein S17 [Anaerolineaceae bacterium]|jgi:small subunit ribosomal protein S17